MIELRTRPLRATDADAAYLVQRPSEMAALIGALEHGFSVMLLGERGSGKTTQLNLLARRLEEEAWQVTQISAGRFDSASDALWAIARAAKGEPTATISDPLGASVAERLNGARGDRLEAAYRALSDVAGGLGERSVILVDGLAPALVHEIFGRLRDEMWALGVQWVVTGDIEAKAVLLAPPADAFFEQTVTLAPFTHREIVDLLTLRDPDGELDARLWAPIAQRCQGNPAKALVLARQAMFSEDPHAAIERGSVVEQIERELGEPAARLADDLARHGPSGPSDPELLRRLGWSRPRAYQVFQALHDAGFTEVTAERTGRAGRPTNTYRLKGLA